MPAAAPRRRETALIWINKVRQFAFSMDFRWPGCDQTKGADDVNLVGWDGTTKM
jgi:hypothetical protein